MESKNVRIAVAQFHVGTDIKKNLATCLRIFEQASQCKPDIVVLPEFCNHLSWYKNQQHCLDVSVSLDSHFLMAISQKIRELCIHAVINCTVNHDNVKVTGSSLLYSPDGELLANNTKQVYIGHENLFLEKTIAVAPIINRPLGKLGLYACMDGVINETPRCLALQGAQVALNSLNSFASDEASLHIPVRATENKIFVAAANKIGPLVPEDMLDIISDNTGIPARYLNGAGESQIVAPNGEVLAKASLDQEEIVFADVDVSLANNKCRPDGTHIFKNRRPEIYTAICENPELQELPDMNGKQTVKAAIVQYGFFNQHEANLHALPALISEAVTSNNAKIIALPPLFDETIQPSILEKYSQKIVDTVKKHCQTAYVATAVVQKCGNGYQYCMALISDKGIVLLQPQLHFSKRHYWSILGNASNTIDLDFARIGLVCSDDSFYPETFRLQAMKGVEITAIALKPLETWEIKIGLLERSAENRINLLVATRPSIFGNSFATTLQTDFTLMTQWNEREFDGLLSQPIVNRATSKQQILPVTLCPANAKNKVVSKDTDLLANRPWNQTKIISAPLN